GQVTSHTFGIIVSYKNFRLVLRNDCNLVLEDMNTWKVMWETNTRSPYGDCFTTMDEFGEFFIKHNRRDVLWRTGVRASERASQALFLRYDGRLMIYNKKIWDLPVATIPSATS
uniref:hypothetical protein n=1 Tax=Mycobacterium tuberculosis TaxID=1773 RepID=UPI00254F060A